MKFVTGHFEADGAIIYLPIGFIPDYFFFCEDTADTQVIFYHWWSAMERDMGTGKQEGISVAEGVTANLGDAGGITAYDTGTETPPIYNWVASTTTLTAWKNASTTTTVTARTATTHGTYIHPTAGVLNVDGQVADPGLIAECVTASGNLAATEFTWPVEVGAQVADGNNVWEIVVPASNRAGYQGVAIAAALMTDGDEHFYNAWLADESIDWGDVTAWSNGIYGS